MAATRTTLRNGQDATGTGEEMADVRWLMAYIIIG